MRGVAFLILMVLAGFAVGGCASDPSRGYSFGHAYDDSIRTVAVPIFDNRTQARGLEVLITEAIIKQIETRTPWAVATTRPLTSRPRVPF